MKYNHQINMLVILYAQIICSVLSANHQQYGELTKCGYCMTFFIFFIDTFLNKDTICSSVKYNIAIFGKLALLYLKNVS